MLRCDICGGELEMQGGGKAVCASCGMKYSTESLREKFNGLKVSITGSRDDVAQWKELMNKYLEKHDYVAAEGIIKKILEADPTDQFANNLYDQMQDWKHLTIVNGILVSYRNGNIVSSQLDYTDTSDANHNCNLLHVLCFFVCSRHI